MLFLNGFECIHPIWQASRSSKTSAGDMCGDWNPFSCTLPFIIFGIKRCTGWVCHACFDNRRTAE